MALCLLNIPDELQYLICNELSLSDLKNLSFCCKQLNIVCLCTNALSAKNCSAYLKQHNPLVLLFRFFRLKIENGQKDSFAGAAAYHSIHFAPMDFVGLPAHMAGFSNFLYEHAQIIEALCWMLDPPPFVKRLKKMVNKSELQYFKAAGFAQICTSCNMVPDLVRKLKKNQEYGVPLPQSRKRGRNETAFADGLKEMKEAFIRNKK